MFQIASTKRQNERYCVLETFCEACNKLHVTNTKRNERLEELIARLELRQKLIHDNLEQLIVYKKANDYDITEIRKKVK